MTTWREVKERFGDPEGTPEYEREGEAIDFGRMVRALREKHNLTQVELAERIGTTQPSIARLEAGGTEPRIETLHRIAAATSVHLVMGFLDDDEVEQTKFVDNSMIAVI